MANSKMAPLATGLGSRNAPPRFEGMMVNGIAAIIRHQRLCAVSLPQLRSVAKPAHDILWGHYTAALAATDSMLHPTRPLASVVKVQLFLVRQSMPAALNRPA
eukprot:scaffold239590_cov28-Tisochrysis_lutea.AAC.1